MTRWEIFKHNFLQFLIAIDQLGNTIIGLFCNSKFYADETLSAHSHRRALHGKPLFEKIVNMIMFFEKDHCKIAYQSELDRAHLPVEEREAQ